MIRKSKTNMEYVPCLYDWSERWKTLEIVSFKSKSWVNLVLGGRDTLLEMYYNGYLTGQAKEDAERIA